MKRRRIRRETKKSLRKISRLWRKNYPLRRLEKAVAADPDTPVMDMSLVLDALLDTSPLKRRERAIASWLIEHAKWTAEQRATLSETLSDVAERALLAQKTGPIITRWFLRGMFVCYPLFLLGLWLDHPPRSFLEGLSELLGVLLMSAVLTFFSGIITLPASLGIDYGRLIRIRPVLKALGEVGQPACIVSLARAVQHDSLREIARPALKSVTKRLRPEDYGTLPGPIVPVLCGALSAVPLRSQLVILKALSVIGDGRAIKTVEHFSFKAHHGEVQDAAARLLPILQQRARDSEAASLLLRASEAPPESGQTLLRATREQATVDPSQLLRIATAPGSEEGL